MSISADSLPAESLRAAVLKALLAEIEASVKGGKAGLKELMDMLDIDSLAARLPDGPKVATVRRAGGKASPKVTDPDKFLAWVQESHPDEVVPAVRESFTRAVLAEVDKNGAAVMASGEAVPGVEFLTGTAYLTVNFEDGGEDAVKQAWREHRISLDSLLALPAAEAAS